ncbi:MAG: imm11 family protein [Armatimonadota bacterium]
MKYFILKYDFWRDNDDGIMLNIDENSFEFDRHDVEQGKTMVYWDEDITLTYDTEDGSIVTDYLANNMIWFAVTERFKLLLTEYASESIQFLPMKVKPLRDDIGLENCYLANIITLVDALDLENSVYSYYGDEEDEEKLLGVKIFALKASKIPPEINIFRLENSKIEIFISEKLWRAMRKNKITGCQYDEIRVID